MALTAKQVQHSGAGKLSDGQGLFLLKQVTDKGRWVLRFTSPQTKKRRELGLGGWPAVSLKEARVAAEAARAKVREGVDPVANRLEDKLNTAARGNGSVHSLADDYTAANAVKHPYNWSNCIRAHVPPALHVEQLTAGVVAGLCGKLWRTNAPTGRRLLARLRQVAKHARAKGFTVDLQAFDDAKELLGKQRGQTVQHRAAMDWHDVPAFYQGLTGRTASVWAVKMCIASGLRVGSVVCMRREWVSVDRISIPGEYMKTGVAFDVPRTDAIDAILGHCPRAGFLFPGRHNGYVSPQNVSRWLSRRDDFNDTLHGFRSTFRQWLDAKECDYHVAEDSIQHALPGVQRAYLRDMFDRRAVWLQKWGHFISYNG